LEIKNPPEGLSGFVIHQYSSYLGSAFTEWETLKDALKAFENFWPPETIEKRFPHKKGFKRYVSCEELTPWFYAVGNQQLIGDYALPEKLQDDPFYRLGRKFVFLKDGVPIIKTCIGAHLVCKKIEYPGEIRKYRERLIFFDDGTSCEVHQSGNAPRPLDDREAWIIEATKQFQLFLTGRNKEFSINLADGNKFVGKLLEETVKSDVAGSYYLVVTFQSGEIKEGQTDFTPSEKVPNIFEYVQQMMHGKFGPIKSVKVKTFEPMRGGKKWKGVFFF
jgi:hypothetical protein